MKSIFGCGVIAVAAYVAACSSSSSSPADGGSTDAGSDVTTDASLPGGPLAAGISLDGIVVYQGTSVPIVTARVEMTSRKIPVIAGRDALVRVFVTPDAAFVARDVVGRLRITSGATVTDFTATLKPAGPSDVAKLDSTLDFDVPGAAITTDAEITVRIEEKPNAPTQSGSTDAATWPVTGTLKLRANSTHGNLTIVVVPFRYTQDASNRLPDTSPANTKAIFDGVAAMFPVPSVDVTVHASVDIGMALSPMGTGWSEWLMQLQALRAMEMPKTNVLYLGFGTPTDTSNGFCSSGCIESMSSGAQTADPANLASVIALFSSSTADGGATMPEDRVNLVANAIAPTLGRLRAPCGGPSPVDMMYPYPGGGIGAWGYDRRTKMLVDSAPTKDFTSFCIPAWTSDYTFAGIFDRVTSINATAK